VSWCNCVNIFASIPLQVDTGGQAESEYSQEFSLHFRESAHAYYILIANKGKAICSCD
jgi:hypothetical protein